MADNLTSKSTELHGPVVWSTVLPICFALFTHCPICAVPPAIQPVPFVALSACSALAKDYPNSPLAVVFDAPGKTFRDDMFEEYKANRAPCQTICANRSLIHEMIKAGFASNQRIWGEADDVISTYAAQATALQRETVISTGDKDMAQLVTSFVTLVNTTETTMDAHGVKEKFGVGPELIIDYLALMVTPWTTSQACPRLVRKLRQIE